MSYVIIMIAGFWFYMENQYFGWNAGPQSVGELFADGFVMLLLALAALSARRA